jgi:hypothetical protein
MNSEIPDTLLDQIFRERFGSFVEIENTQDLSQDLTRENSAYTSATEPSSPNTPLKRVRIAWNETEQEDLYSKLYSFDDLAVCKEGKINLAKMQKKDFPSRSKSGLTSKITTHVKTLVTVYKKGESKDDLNKYVKFNNPAEAHIGDAWKKAIKGRKNSSDDLP